MTHWLEHLLELKSLDRLKRERWKILREGSEFPSQQFARSWQLTAKHGSAEQGSIKCVLSSPEHGDQCEMVVLFPGNRENVRSKGRATVCVSSQIGCGVGCQFCATGTMGFRRNLCVWDILEQVYIARRIAIQENRHLRNVVYMGMGEPLHNTSQVLASLRWLISDKGFGISPKHITVSTSGIRSAMLTLAKAQPLVRIALSLHSAEEGQRRSLMPRVGNDLKAMRETLREINAIQKSDPIWLEYILIAGLNDSQADAARLIEFCAGLRVEVNLIPYNPIGIAGAQGWTQPDRSVRLQFAESLRQAGIKTTIRHSFGQSDNAACGQLVVPSGLPITNESQQEIAGNRGHLASGS